MRPCATMSATSYGSRTRSRASGRCGRRPPSAALDQPQRSCAEAPVEESVNVKVESVLWVDRQVEPLREKTVKVLREAILSEHLKPGQQLVERELCQQTGVSRS